MRIKVYLFSKYAKARAQSFSVFVLSIITNGSKGINQCAHALISDICLVGCTSQQPDGFLPLRAFKPSSSESAGRGRSIIQVTDNREYIKIQEWLMSYVQRNI
jgi:hypothetical protein